MTLQITVTPGVTIALPLHRIKERKYEQLVRLANDELSNTHYSFYFLLRHVQPYTTVPTIELEVSHPDVKVVYLDLMTHDEHYVLVQISSFNKSQLRDVRTLLHHVFTSDDRIKLIRQNVVNLKVYRSDNDYYLVLSNLLTVGTHNEG